MRLNNKAINEDHTKMPKPGESRLSYLSPIQRMASIVLDDSTTRLSFGGGQWSLGPMDRFFGGFATWPQFAVDDTEKFGTLNFVFQGMLDYLLY